MSEESTTMAKVSENIDNLLRFRAEGIENSSLQLTFRDFGSSPVDQILVEFLYPTIELFRQKARDYQADQMFAADLLGSRGQFADLWRKIPKLKRAMWDKLPLEGEPVEEILMDFIGHAFLSLDFVKKEKLRETESSSSAQDES